MLHIQTYHRPTNITDALQLLARPQINTVVIAGGTSVVPRMSQLVDEVVDLQAVGLTQVDYTGKGLTLGAMVKLQTILDDTRAPSLLHQAAGREGPNTFRNAATIGGVVASSRKDSELLAALLVLDAQVKVQTLNDTRNLSLADFLQDVSSALSGGIITAISLATIGKTACARVGRTPADTSIVAACGRLAEDGQIRLALSGVTNVPVLVNPDNVKSAINPIGDFRGSTEYRRQMAAVLTKRVVDELTHDE